MWRILCHHKAIWWQGRDLALMQWETQFLSACLLSLLVPGTPSSCPSLCFSVPLLSSGSWGQWCGESTEKDLDVQELRALTRRLWETGVFQRLCCVKTPPSGLEGGVGRPTRQLACCLQPNAPWCLVSGWGVLSLGHKWHGVTCRLSLLPTTLSVPPSPAPALMLWVHIWWGQSLEATPESAPTHLQDMTSGLWNSRFLPLPPSPPRQLETTIPNTALLCTFIPKRLRHFVTTENLSLH